MGDVKVKVKVSHLAVGSIGKDLVETKTVYSKGQEFTCSEEVAKGLGTSIVVIEKITAPENTEIPLPEYATVTAVNEGDGSAIVETQSGKNVKIQTKR